MTENRPVKVNLEVVGADPRVELMSLLFRLAGSPEYSRCIIKGYDRAIREHFAGFEVHPAVRMAAKLREARGVGFDAVMVTDTSFYRDPRYHTAADTPDNLDLDAMARVADGLAAVLRHLVDGTPVA